MDTDSGRLDPTAVGGRGGFAPPAASDTWVFNVRDESIPSISAPEKIPFTEEGIIELLVTEFLLDAGVSISSPTDSLAFANPGIIPKGFARSIPIGDLPEGRLSFTVISPADNEAVTVETKGVSSTNQVFFSTGVRII